MTLKLTTHNYIDIHLKDDEKRPLVLIAPGGGYQRTSEREAIPIANKFMVAGYHTAIIYYREALLKDPACINELSAFYQTLQDKLKDKITGIILCGFSSGGHYMANLGVSYHRFGLTKPLALILSYPVITGEEGFAHEDSIERLYGQITSETRAKFSLEKKVSKDTPITFLFHTVDDHVVPYQNSLWFFQALDRHHIDCDLHLYHKGVHGISLGTSDVKKDEDDPIIYDKENKHNQSWYDLAVSFLKQHNI